MMFPLKQNHKSITPAAAVPPGTPIQVRINGTDWRKLTLCGRADGEEMRARSMEIYGHLTLGMPSIWWPGADGTVEFWPAASKDFEIQIGAPS